MPKPSHLVFIGLFLLTFAVLSVDAYRSTAKGVSTVSGASAVTVTVTTNLAGVAFSVDSVVYHSAQSFNWEIGSSHVIAAESPQYFDSETRYVWRGWSDGGAQSHTIIVSDEVANITALFEREYLLTMISRVGSTSPSTGFHYEGAAVQIEANVPTGCAFQYWEGSGLVSYTGPMSRPFVYMFGPITEIAHISCSTPTPSPTPTPTATATPPAAFDYDGDRQSDISVFRPSEGNWYFKQPGSGFLGIHFGLPEDKIVPADYDGDFKTDIAVYRPSTGIWYILNSATGTISYNWFGLADDLPVPADYDGDGKADVAVYRQSDATWYWQQTSDGSYHAFPFGISGDTPAVGDFDGDGKSDISVVRGWVWYHINSSDGSFAQWSSPVGAGIPTQADYDGDRKTDYSVFVPATRTWFFEYSSSPFPSSALFGLATDIPAPGDYDGDGKADICVFRPSDGMWYVRNSSNGSDWAFRFGLSSDEPTQAAFQY